MDTLQYLILKIIFIIFIGMNKERDIELIDGVIHIYGIAIPHIKVDDFEKFKMEQNMNFEFMKIIDQIIEFSKKYERKSIKIEFLDNDLYKLNYSHY